MRVRIALAAGLALTVIALVAVLSRPPLVVARTTLTGPVEGIVEELTSATVHRCFPDERIPGGTSAVQLSVGSTTLGALVNVKLYTHSHLLAEGTKPAGWRGQGVTVYLQRIAHAVNHATVCFTIGPLNEALLIFGRSNPATKGRSHGAGPPSRMRIEYLRNGRRSWLSMAEAVARRMGLGRAFAGTWIALLPTALTLAVVVLASWLIVRELAPRRPSGRFAFIGHSWRLGALPTPALICMAIAVFNAWCWSLITPLFQVEDEADHFAYVQQLAERGALPSQSANPRYSREEDFALRDLLFFNLRFNTDSPAIGSDSQQRQLERDLNSKPSRVGSGTAGEATSDPPLFYALQVAPYKLGAGGSLLLRLQLMRFLTALMAAASALFVFLFLRETLPGTPWAWTVGALSASLAPLLGSISGSINPDAMLCAVSAACFYCIARGFRRGLTHRLAISIGVLTAIGFLTKLNFVGLAPGVIAGLTTLTYRARDASGGAAYRWFIQALAIAFSPIVIYVMANLVKNGATVQIITNKIPNPLPHGSPIEELNYVWQSYLPALPGMSADFRGVSIWREVWFDGLVGAYGWHDTSFPTWVDNAALIPATLSVALCIRALSVARTALRERFAELAIYAATAIGLLVSLGVSSYNTYPASALEFHPVRYLLPLLALAAAGVALSARAAGRRWGPTVGTLLVVLILAHNLFSQLLIIARYYGRA